MEKWYLGNIEIERVLEFEGPLLSPFEMFPDCTEEAIEGHRHWLEPSLMDSNSGLFILAFHSIIIRTPDHTILVDTCGGNNKNRPQRARYHMKQWPYLNNLASAGLAPEEVDFVFCTHLHVDHVGWNTRLQNGRWVPTFPNARYLFGKREWEYWREQFQGPEGGDHPHYQDSILPIIEANQAEFVDKDFELDKVMRLEPSPGHTPGHFCAHLSSGGSEAILSGDLMHHAIQCAEPDWNSCFCIEPESARTTRRAFLDQYCETDTLIFPAHFPTPVAGRIIQADDTWHFKFK